MGAINGEGVEDVRDGGDVADEEGEVVVEQLRARALHTMEAAEAGGVAGAVVALVVLQDDESGRLIHPLQGGEQLVGAHGVLADGGAGSGWQLAGAVVHLGRERQHGDVPQEHAVGQAMEGGFVEGEGAAEADGDRGGVDGVVEPLGGPAAHGPGHTEGAPEALLASERAHGGAQAAVQVVGIVGPQEGLVAPDREQEVNGGDERFQDFGAGFRGDELGLEGLAVGEEHETTVAAGGDEVQQSVRERDAGLDEGAAHLIEDAGAKNGAGRDVRDCEPPHDPLRRSDHRQEGDGSQPGALSPPATLRRPVRGEMGPVYCRAVAISRR